MHPTFEFHKQLNFKKILIFIIILLFLIVIVSEILSNLIEKNKEKKIEKNNPNSTFISYDSSIILDLPKTYGFSQYKSNSNYLLELRTQDNLNIFVSKKNLTQSRPLIDIVTADQNTYIENFKHYSNLSNITDLKVNENYPAYTYSLHYLDNKLKTPFYLQIIWIQTNSGYYVIDVEFPLENLDSYSKIITDIVTKIKINN